MIIRYYESLKTKVTWLLEDPYFWMQYAMRHIAARNYEKAQRLLENAYGKAKRRINYYIEGIDVQQARLYMLKSLHSISLTESISYFTKAHSLLIRIRNSIYKYRQLHFYRDFYNEKSKNFDEYTKKYFLNLCRKMLENLDSNERNRLEIDEYERMKCYDMIENIVLKISNSK